MQETPRNQWPIPGWSADWQLWQQQFLDLLNDQDATVFANTENLKVIFSSIPNASVIDDAGTAKLVMTGDLVLISRTLNTSITIDSSTDLELQAGYMIGVVLTPGAVGPQDTVFELYSSVEIDPSIQVFGYVDDAYTINWFNGSTLEQGDPARQMFSFKSTAGGGDTYKVMTTAADTTPGYLSSKLIQGSGVTLTVQNPGANENILIDASGTGYWDRTGTVLSPLNSGDSVEITIPDTTNASALILTQNDDTNGEHVLEIVQNASTTDWFSSQAHSIYLRGTGGSDDGFVIFSDGDVILGAYESSGNVTSRVTAQADGSANIATVTVNALATNAGDTESVLSLVSDDDLAGYMYAKADLTADTENGYDAGFEARSHDGGYGAVYVWARDISDPKNYVLVQANTTPYAENIVMVSETGSSLNAAYFDLKTTLLTDDNKPVGWSSDGIALSSSGAEWDDIETLIGSEGSIFAAILAAASAAGTLDAAYDYGGSGAGRAITADSGAVTIAVPDNGNTYALELTQGDVTNLGPGGLKITRNSLASGPGNPWLDAYSIFLTGNYTQTIWSDKEFIIGKTGSGGGYAWVYLSQTASGGVGYLSSRDTASLHVATVQVNSTSSACYIELDAEVLRFTDGYRSGSTWTTGYIALSSTSQEWSDVRTLLGDTEGTLFDAILAASTNWGTLDDAYDFGGAGAGKGITADAGAVTITVPLSGSNGVLALTNQESTNNVALLNMYNDASLSTGYLMWLDGDAGGDDTDYDEFGHIIWSPGSITIGHGDTTDGSGNRRAYFNVAWRNDSGGQPYAQLRTDGGVSWASSAYFESFIDVNGIAFCEITSSDIVDITDGNISGSNWPTAYFRLSSGSTEWTDLDTLVDGSSENHTLVGAILAASQVGGGGGGTLDTAYDFGSAGGGRTITADSGAVTINVPDTSGNSALALTQNDDTGDANVLDITQNSSTTNWYDDAYAIYLTGTATQGQVIFSDKDLVVGVDRTDADSVLSILTRNSSTYDSTITVKSEQTTTGAGLVAQVDIISDAGGGESGSSSVINIISHVDAAVDGGPTHEVNVFCQTSTTDKGFTIDGYLNSIAYSNINYIDYNEAELRDIGGASYKQYTVSVSSNDFTIDPDNGIHQNVTISADSTWDLSDPTGGATRTTVWLYNSDSSDHTLTITGMGGATIHWVGDADDGFNCVAGEITIITVIWNTTNDWAVAVGDSTAEAFGV